MLLTCNTVNVSTKIESFICFPSQWEWELFQTSKKIPVELDNLDSAVLVVNKTKSDHE